MGIRFHCHQCNERLNIKSYLGGKRGRCPHCDTRFRIPTQDQEFSIALDDEPSASSASSSTNDRPSDADSPSNHPDPLADLTDDCVWYVRPPSGGQYGPADSLLMKQWLEECRVVPGSLVWRDPWPQWRAAEDVFPAEINPLADDTPQVNPGVTADASQASQTKQPRAEQPPAEQPPAEQPPAEQPPAEQPPAEEPRAEEPRAEQPRAEQPPAEEPEPAMREAPETPAASPLVVDTAKRVVRARGQSAKARAANPRARRKLTVALLTGICLILTALLVFVLLYTSPPQDKSNANTATESMISSTRPQGLALSAMGGQTSVGFLDSESTTRGPLVS